MFANLVGSTKNRLLNSSLFMLDFSHLKNLALVCSIKNVWWALKTCTVWSWIFGCAVSHSPQLVPLKHALIALHKQTCHCLHAFFIWGHQSKTEHCVHWEKVKIVCTQVVFSTQLISASLESILVVFVSLLSNFWSQRIAPSSYASLNCAPFWTVFIARHSKTVLLHLRSFTIIFRSLLQ